MTEVSVSLRGPDGEEEVITVDLPQTLVDRCQRAADKSGETLGEWVSHAMIEFDRDTSGFDVAAYETVDEMHRALIMTALREHADRRGVQKRNHSYRVDEELE